MRRKGAAGAESWQQGRPSAIAPRAARGYHARRMRGFVYALVERLAEPGSGLSRNRHRALFETPAGSRALHLARHLRSLLDGLVHHGDAAKLSVHHGPDGGLQVRVAVPALRLVRTSFLSGDDVALLRRPDGPLAALGELLLAAAEGGPPDPDPA